MEGEREVWLAPEKGVQETGNLARLMYNQAVPVKDATYYYK